jgi:hypothetical protein
VRAERQIARDGVERDSTPRDPATSRPRARLWLWVLPFLVAVVELLLNTPLGRACTSPSWCSGSFWGITETL